MPTDPNHLAECWTPDSWRSKPIKQDVQYTDNHKLERCISKLSHLPPLVSPAEIENLRGQLKDVGRGKAFLLQGGDCAELFDYCSKGPIDSKIKVLIQMSLVLIWGGRVPVVRVARMAGQYAKPRSSPVEVVDGQEHPSFRGDNINGYELGQREPDPERLVQAYFHSAATLNYVRTILNSGFADLNNSHAWDLSHVRCGAIREEYQKVVNQLSDTLDFMKTIKVIGAATPSHAMHSVELFMSHEALLLDYESALTRCLPDPKTGARRWYNTSGHFLWVGDRTRQPDGAHIEYLSGIANPLGIKVGPTTDPDELVALLEKLNPGREEGRITLITRFGYKLIEKCLPAYILAVQGSGHPVVWVCDPMHGNTEMSLAGVKTRHFSNILGEVGRAFRTHAAYNSKLNGVHFELTGDSVTECVGGSMELDHHQLNDNYQTYCDPRLNYEQSLDMAFLIARYYQRERTGLQEL
ncbi:hypothetical protein L0F63_007413 [Massospora cicadina]|nr:hypothetical protein L0F63_007413 [Massospora cicadina]